MPASSITKLPLNLRSNALRKISANANAPGGCKKQTNGRPRLDATSRLAGVLGIYPIESKVTGPLAASVGGGSPTTIDTGGGTPAATAIATNEQDAVTWVGAGPKVLTVTITANLAGEAVVTV